MSRHGSMVKHVTVCLLDPCVAQVKTAFLAIPRGLRFEMRSASVCTVPATTNSFTVLSFFDWEMKHGGLLWGSWSRK